MRDLMFLLLAVGFFALGTLYVRACTAVVGPEQASTADAEAAAAVDAEAETEAAR